MLFELFDRLLYKRHAEDLVDRFVHDALDHIEEVRGMKYREYTENLINKGVDPFEALARGQHIERVQGAAYKKAVAETVAEYRQSFAPYL